MPQFAPLSRLLSRFAADRRGAVAVAFVAGLAPVVVAVGVAIEYHRMSAAKAELQLALDAASLETATHIAAQVRNGVTPNNGDVTAKFTAAMQARAAGQALLSAGASLSSLSARQTVASGLITVAANAEARVPASLGSLIAIQNYTVHARARVSQSAAPYMNVSLVLDVSPSMAVAATPAEISRLATITAPMAGGACAFACHDLYYGVNYYTVARNNGVRLRIDVMKTAAIDFVNAVAARNLGPGQVSFTTYQFGALASLVTPQTTNTATVTGAIGALDFHRMSQIAPTLPAPAPTYLAAGASSEHYADTDYARLFSTLNASVPANGTGASASDRQQLVIIVTDGVAHTAVPNMSSVSATYDYRSLAPGQLPTAAYGNSMGRLTAPIDPAVCSTLKQRGVRVAVLNTPYYRMPPSLESAYESLIQTNAPPDIVTAKLKACASSLDLYAEAADAADIYPALLSLYRVGATVARLER